MALPPGVRFDLRQLSEAHVLLLDACLSMERQVTQLDVLTYQTVSPTFGQLDNIRARLAVAAAKVASARDKLGEVLDASVRGLDREVQP